MSVTSPLRVRVLAGIVAFASVQVISGAFMPVEVFAQTHTDEGTQGKASMDWSKEGERLHGEAHDPSSPSDQRTGTTKGAVNHERREDNQNSRELVSRAITTLKNMRTGVDGRSIPDGVYSRARCVAVFPGILNAAVGIGARHGKGVVSCRQSNKSWSPVAFLNLNGGSIGAQIGAAKTDLVLLFMSENGRERLESGKFNLGADAGVIAGDTTKTATVTTDSKNDIVAYASQEGAYIGASLSGTGISSDDDRIKSFYNNQMDYRKTLMSSEFSHEPTVVKEFITLMPGDRGA